MKRILSNDELEIGKVYWCKAKNVHYMPDPQALTVYETGGIKYISQNRIWADDNNNQALENYDIIGPIEYPNFENY